MTTREIEAIENAGRTATVWIPEQYDRPIRPFALPVVASALGMIAAVGVLLAFLA